MEHQIDYKQKYKTLKKKLKFLVYVSILAVSEVDSSNFEFGLNHCCIWRYQSKNHKVEWQSRLIWIFTVYTGILFGLQG